MKFQKLQIITNVVLKSVIILIIIIEFIALGWPLTARIRTQLESGALIAKIKMWELQVDFFNDKINTETRLRGNEDSSPPGLIAEVTKQFNIEKETWAFVGTYQNEAWTTSYFDIQGLPEPGDILTATGEINRRADKPRFIDNEWRMGEIEGSIEKGDKMQITEVDKVKHKGGYLVVWIKGIVVK